MSSTSILIFALTGATISFPPLYPILANYTIIQILLSFIKFTFSLFIIIYFLLS
ncbi:hypothetical protein CLB_0613 [Clostridium botulinum A str. ATCC 19397]|nr:hypothetical protein CLB_0613 [Clostridium botulinum A str. ATCC 19397]